MIPNDDDDNDRDGGDCSGDNNVNDNEVFEGWGTSRENQKMKSLYIAYCLHCNVQVYHILRKRLQHIEV